MHRRAFLLAALFLAACSQAPTTPTPQPESNAAPTVTLIASQLEGEAEFSVNFVVEAADPDADILTYRYTVNGEAIEHGESTLALTFYKTGSYRVEVSVSDGEHTIGDSVRVTARDELRPADAPDVVLLGFAGRCGHGFGDCSAPTDNYSYLDRTPETLQTLESTFQSLGYSTRSLSFRANLEDHAAHGLGYQAAEYALEAIRDLWIRDYENPTRVVLVAHSHGNQFMSLLAMNHPEVTFDYAYLDAVCFRWDADHVKSGRFGSVYGSQVNWPKPLNTLGAACDTVKLPGISDYQDISDVVPDNVTYALEVRSNGVYGLPMVYDDEINHRFDGSRRGVAGIYQEDEDHMQVHGSNSAALSWVMNTVANTGLPTYGIASQAVKSLEVAPAPEGFELNAP